MWLWTGSFCCKGTLLEQLVKVSFLGVLRWQCMLHCGYIKQCSCLWEIYTKVFQLWPLQCSRSLTAGSSAKRQLVVASHYGRQPQPKNAASPKALYPAQGSPHPIAHFYRDRGPDLSPNSEQCCWVIPTVELSTG